MTHVGRKHAALINTKNLSVLTVLVFIFITRKPNGMSTLKTLMEGFYKMKFVSYCPRHPLHFVHRYATKSLHDVWRVILQRGRKRKNWITLSFKSKINRQISVQNMTLLNISKKVLFSNTSQWIRQTVSYFRLLTSYIKRLGPKSMYYPP